MINILIIKYVKLPVHHWNKREKPAKSNLCGASFKMNSEHFI